MSAQKKNAFNTDIFFYRKKTSVLPLLQFPTSYFLTSWEMESLN